VKVPNMQLVVIHEPTACGDANASGFLPFVLATDPLAAVLYQEHAKSNCLPIRRKTVVVPAKWQVRPAHNGIALKRYEQRSLFGGNLKGVRSRSGWCVISNGRFITDTEAPLGHLLKHEDQLVAFNVDPALNAYREKVGLGSGGCVAGFKRIYSHSVVPGFLGDHWPHHLCIRFSILDRLLVDDRLPLEFGDFLNVCSMRSLSCRCFNVGGRVLDLAAEEGILQLLNKIGLLRNSRIRAGGGISHNAKFVGDVLVQEDVYVGEDAVIIGPAILGANCHIGRRAVVKNSIVASNVSVTDGAVLRDRILMADLLDVRTAARVAGAPDTALGGGFSKSGYRKWPRLSYPRFTKRMADIAFALTVIILFAPILPIVALVIKLDSKGPVFFAHRRQGLHGLPFKCLKFRTMIVQADVMQDKLRSQNHVDGPQFKIDDDPRVTTAGKFLRDTFIDELPQFFNVLLGQMSVVGPRPSPESENMLCPFWRDARLSVRPGITGLWQVLRTRQTGQDFQEWIHYDTQYVRNMSVRQDLSICGRTTLKLIGNFFQRIRR